MRLASLARSCEKEVEAGLRILDPLAKLWS